MVTIDLILEHLEVGLYCLDILDFFFSFFQRRTSQFTFYDNKKLSGLIISTAELFPKADDSNIGGLL